MELLRKYGALTTILFPLIERDAVDFEATPVTFSTGDAQIIKDEEAPENTTNDPSHEGNGVYSLVLTATEMQAARIVITVIDSATKEWEDQAILIGTYGNASGQHAFDLDLAEQLTALSATGKEDVNAEVDTALSDYDAPTKAEMDTAHDLLATEAKQDIMDAIVDAIKIVTDNLPNSGALNDLATILADTGELQADWTDGGRLDLLVDAIKAVTDLLPDGGLLSDLATILSDTNELQTDDVPGLIAALNDPTVTAIADQVWDEAKSGHVGAGSMGEEIQSHSTHDDPAADIAEIQSDTDNIQTRLPAALVGGRIDASVGAMVTNVLTAAAIGANAITAAKLAADAIGSSELSAAAAQKIADELLKRPLSNVEPAEPGLRTLYGALASLVNRVKINGANLEIYETDDVTLVASIPITTSADQQPITEIDPE